MSGRTLAVGDIHGCLTAFDTLLGMLSVTADDTLVILGDVVDRGPATKQVIDRLLELESRCRLICIQGNHEEMMLNVFRRGEWGADWLMCGGWETLQSYGGKDHPPAEHLDFLESFADYHETPREIFVHAGLAEEYPLDQQPHERLRWSRFSEKLRPWSTGQRVICGHTSQPSGLPRRIPGWVCIDTLVYGGGWLTALDVWTEEIFQADEQGRSRTGILA